MKRVITGGIFMFTGSLISLAIMLSAALYVPSMNSWSGSKLWFAIFGAENMEMK